MTLFAEKFWKILSFTHEPATILLLKDLAPLKKNLRYVSDGFIFREGINYFHPSP